MKSRIISYSIVGALAALVVTGMTAGPAVADTVSGTVTFQGTASMPNPITGITLDDLTVSAGLNPERTEPSEDCAITQNDLAGVDAVGNYPESGTLTIGISVTKHGNGSPSGGCIVQLQASGHNAGVSAYGFVDVEVTQAEITGNATVVADDIVVLQSKSVAGVDSDCLKYLKKQAKFRGKCNAALWKMGPVDGALKCKTEVEPPGCDPANYVESVLALSFGDMDQQTDPPSAETVDLDTVADQAKCQRYIGKAAANFFATRSKLVEKKCVEATDTAQCRDSQTNDARVKLSLIDNCVTQQAIDAGSALQIADVDEPCKSLAINGSLVLDRKALRDCFEDQLVRMSDNVVGDVPICGNAVVQQGEQCDDGNAVGGDCCSATRQFEATTTDTCGIGACQVTATCTAGVESCTPGTPGTEVGHCGDSVDNDCDGLTDTADTLDCP